MVLEDTLYVLKIVRLELCSIADMYTKYHQDFVAIILMGFRCPHFEQAMSLQIEMILRV